MRLRELVLLLSTAVATAFGTPAIAVDNSLFFQGVTFETTAVDSDTMLFSILNAATGATGNWSGIAFLKAFEIKDIGNVTGATISPANLNPVDLNLNASGCPGPAGSGGMCFLATTPVSLSDSMSWTIDFAGTGLNFSFPHLKVDFYTTLTQTKATGDLLSQNIPTAVPEPEIYAMLAAGLGLMGFVARRRKGQVAAA